MDYIMINIHNPTILPPPIMKQIQATLPLLTTLPITSSSRMTQRQLLNIEVLPKEPETYDAIARYTYALKVKIS